MNGFGNERGINVQMICIDPFWVLGQDLVHDLS